MATQPDTQNPIAAALTTLKAAMDQDAGYAWGWHCNISMPIVDAAGVSHKQANEAAAHLMQHLFDYDITTHPHYDYGKSGAQSHAEMRMAMDEQEDAEIAKIGGAA